MVMMDRPFTNTGAGAETLETKKPQMQGARVQI
jgi:hypothetical protein